jgi:hypothetical protein
MATRSILFLFSLFLLLFLLPGGNCSNSGADQPILAITPSSLTFTSSQTSLYLTIDNQGGGTLSWNAEYHADWLTCSPVSGSIEKAPSVILVALRLESITPGMQYSGEILFSSNGGSRSIGISYQADHPIENDEDRAEQDQITDLEIIEEGLNPCDACGNRECGSYGDCSSCGTCSGCDSQCVGNYCQAESHAIFYCYDGDIWWYDSCDNRETVKEQCEIPCTGTSQSCPIPPTCDEICGNRECGSYGDCPSCGTCSGCESQCVGNYCQPLSQDSYRCYNGNIWWFDSCGNRETVKEQCEIPCTGTSQSCPIPPTCDEICGNRECGSYGDCPSCGTCEGCEDCVNNYCYASAHDSFECHDGDIWWYDSCNDRETIKEHCDNGCDGQSDSCIVATGCTQDEEEWTQLGGRICSANFDDPFTMTIDDGDHDRFVLSITDTDGCEVGPGIQIDQYGSNDLDIGAWYKCQDYSYAEINCTRGRWVSSGQDSVCDNYPCCVSTTYQAADEVIEMSNVSCPGGNNSGWMQVKVYGSDVSGCQNYRVNTYRAGY